MDNTVDRAHRMVETFPFLMKMFHRIGPGAVAEAAVTLPQFHALAAFLVRPEWNLSDLADFLHVKPPAASELVERLVKADMIQRQTNPDDRRQTILTLTAPGNEFLEQRKANMVSSYSRMLKLLPVEDQVCFENAIRELSRIAILFDEMEKR